MASLKAWVKWVFAFLGLFIGFGLALLLRDRTYFKGALASAKKAEADRSRAKADSARRKNAEARGMKKAERYLVIADRADAEASVLEEEAHDIAKEAAQDITDGERARRFNARHGLSDPS